MLGWEDKGRGARSGEARQGGYYMYRYALCPDEGITVAGRQARQDTTRHDEKMRLLIPPRRPEPEGAVGSSARTGDPTSPMALALAMETRPKLGSKK